MSGLGESIYKQGCLDMLISLVKEGLLNLSDACRTANMSETEFLQFMERDEKR